jgi:hypothetical protein
VAGRPRRHHLVRIDSGQGLAAEDVGHGLAHQRDARGAAHRDHPGEVAGGDAGVAKRLPAWRRRALDEGPDHLLELAAVESHRPGDIQPRQGRHQDLGLGARGQGDLGLLGEIEQVAQRARTQIGGRLVRPQPGNQMLGDRRSKSSPPR